MALWWSEGGRLFLMREVPLCPATGHSIHRDRQLRRGNRAESIDHPLRHEAPPLGRKPLGKSREGSRLPGGSR